MTRGKSITTLVVTGVVGYAIATAIDRIPNKPEQYTVTAKDRCLPPEGIGLRLNYRGTGVVDITVVPPTPAAPEKRESK